MPFSRSLPASAALALLTIAACGPEIAGTQASPDRLAAIPASAIKALPQTDPQPPLMLSADFNDPVPLPATINTAGAEDSPFILPDGNKLYFFFTPDVSLPAERQVADGVSGIYVATWSGGTWSPAQRVLLQDSGKLALDGCEFVLGDRMWFCSAREGYTGLNWFTADHLDGTWSNWTLANFDPTLAVGELHISAGGDQLFFGSDRPGGKGGLDIWMSASLNGEWQAPVNVAAVNSSDDEGWPALSADGSELWFYRNWAIWRSRSLAGQWTEPELIVSPLAGEPSLDSAGNLYFVHHYYSGDTMLEADIYVAARR